MIRKTAILAVLLVTFLCIASLSPFASAQPPCDHNVTVNSVICDEDQIEGWFHNATGWYYVSRYTPLFNLTIIPDGRTYDAFCHDLDKPLATYNTFNASIYLAEPNCRNNSIAHI